MNIQLCIDLIRKKYKKIEKNINGQDNKIIKLVQEKEHPIKYLRKTSKFELKGENNYIKISDNTPNNIIPKSLKFKINGSNNKIIIEYDEKEQYSKDLLIKISGNNNTIFIKNCSFTNSAINMNGDNNKFSLGQAFKNINGAKFTLGRGATVEIGTNCEIGNNNLSIIANGDYKTKHKIVIGDGTHIAKEALIRNSNGECLIDPVTKNVLPNSEPQDIIIGKDCWITSRCTILKGAVLPDKTIVAACSLVNKPFEKSHTLIGGTPARVLKENVDWYPASYGAYLEKQENNHEDSHA